MEINPQSIELEALLSELWPEGSRGRDSHPWDEAEIDGWERAPRLGFGQDTHADPHSYIYGDVRVGAHSWVGPFTLLDGSGGLEIGHHTMICAGVQIYSHDSVKWALSGGRAGYEQAPVKIGNCCYVGSGTIVARGVTIGDHTLVGAGSFVNRDLPPHSMAVGSPCRVIGRVIVAEDGTVELIREPQPGG